MPDVQRRDWTAAEYFADPSTSNSKLKVFMEASRLYAGYWVTRDIPQPPPGPAMRWGSLVHLRVLEPDDFVRTVAVKREGLNRKSNAGKAEIADLEAEGVQLVSLAERRCLEGIYDAVMRHPLAGRLVEQLDKEVPYTWTDEATGLPCRCKFDMVSTRGRGGIGDLKTTDDPSPRAFGKSAAKYGYHHQAAFYSRPIAELTGEDPHYWIVAVRSEPPFEVAIYSVSLFQRAAADQQITAAMQRLRACMETSDWSAPWEMARDQPLQLPQWALPSERSDRNRIYQDII